MPGTLVIFVGVLLYALMTDFSVIGGRLILILLVMSVFAELSDNLLSMLGARRSGASRGSAWAVLIGGIAGALAGGMIAPVIGALIGAFIGGVVSPVVFEYLKSGQLASSVRAGTGALIGRIAGIFFRLVIALTMIVISLARIL